jgi:hypothetical protein
VKHTGSYKDLLDKRRLSKLPGNGVLTATSTDQEDVEFVYGMLNVSYAIALKLEAAVNLPVLDMRNEATSNFSNKTYLLCGDAGIFFGSHDAIKL